MNKTSLNNTDKLLTYLNTNKVALTYQDKIEMLEKINKISGEIDCPHTDMEILSFIQNILNLEPDSEGCVVEAGCYKGGSSAKISLATNIVNRELVIFDSFQGIPRHSENHELNIYGKPVTFSEGEYCGKLEEVKSNITRLGNADRCRFIAGWFEDTLPYFKQPIAALYIDVDLAASVKTCIKYLYPLLNTGGTLFCHDGHLPLVIELLDDKNFWFYDVGVEKPKINGLGKEKLITIKKAR